MPTLIALHHRVLCGDATAREDFAALSLPWLRWKLRSAFRRTAEDMLSNAAEDAILEFLRRPERFDSSKGVSLDAFLYMTAWRRLANQVRNVRVRARREAIYMMLSTRTDILNLHRRDPASISLREVLATIPDRGDRRAALHWFAGDSVAQLATALGVAHLSIYEQKREVKRFKDRIRKRLRDRRK